MSTELSLESIKECLVMEEKELECIEMIIHPDTEAFLRREKENQDSNLQKLKQENESIENFLESIGNEERAEAKLAEAIARVVANEQESKTAESDAQKTVELFETQKQHVGSIENELATIKNRIAKTSDLCGCMWELRQKEDQLEKKLKQAKRDLENKALDKTTKDQLKMNSDAELQKNKALKTQAENELNLVKETHQKMQDYEARLGAAKQGFDDVENMLKQLEEMENIYGEGIIIEPIINMPVQQEWSEL